MLIFLFQYKVLSSCIVDCNAVMYTYPYNFVCFQSKWSLPDKHTHNHLSVIYNFVHSRHCFSRKLIDLQVENVGICNFYKKIKSKFRKLYFTLVHCYKYEASSKDRTHEVEIITQNSLLIIVLHRNSVKWQYWGL